MKLRLVFVVSIRTFFAVTPRRTFAQRSSAFLAVLGALSFLAFAGTSYIVYKAASAAAEVAIRSPSVPVDWRLAILLMVLLVPIWLYFTVMSRCQALLVERHFR